MRIEFLKQHGVYRIGDVIDHPHDGVADTLVRRGIAIVAGDDPVEDETAGESNAPPKPKKPTRKRS